MSTLAADVLAGLAPELSLRGATGRAIARLDRYRFLLLLRFALINFTGFALLAAAWLQGWIAQILAADDTHICKLIFVLFLAGLALSAQKVWMLSRELNALDVGPSAGPSKIASLMRGIAGRAGATRQALAGVLRLKLAHRIALRGRLADSLRKVANAQARVESLQGAAVLIP